jgi:outer membrane protein assembly factor BamB
LTRTRANFVTLAYDAATGTRLWAARFSGPRSYEWGVHVASMAVSPDGARVVVTGTGYGDIRDSADFVTAAFRAATGARLWARHYNGPASGTDVASAVAVSPGGRVYVTGTSGSGKARAADFATVAYRGASGTGMWASRYNGPASGNDSASSVAVGTRGRVYVTGTSGGGRARGPDYATVAYRGASGKRLWASRYNGPASGIDEAAAVAVSAAGEVFVTGRSDGGAFPGYDYATIAYRTATGSPLWASRYNGPGISGLEGTAVDVASAITVSPGGTRVLVTGSSTGQDSTDGYATVAYHS